MGEPYETVFSLPAGGSNLIQYYAECCGEVEGPYAIAVQPDESFLIGSKPGKHLLLYTKLGRLTSTIELDDLGVIVDLVVQGEEIFLLETGYKESTIHHLTLDGSRLSSEKIPLQYLQVNGLGGFDIDCDGNILIDLIGSGWFRLSDVQANPGGPTGIKGHACNGKLYNLRSGFSKFGQIIAGDTTYEMRFITSGGSLRLLSAFPDGSFYIVRDEIYSDKDYALQIDTTVHYIGANDTVQAVARVPYEGNYYIPNRALAVSPSGEVYALMPYKDRLDILRLNFYPSPGPLIPGRPYPIIQRISNP